MPSDSTAAAAAVVKSTVIMKKQFYKVKQLADQTFSRAGKTEVLTDDLQAANKHVEHINNTVVGLNKRFGNPNNAANDPAMKEKRIKKCPEYLLGQTMLENVVEDGKGLISYTLNECGKTEVALANEIVDHEFKVEQLVASPIHQMLDTDIPNIHKLKKELKVLVGNVDNLRTRHQQAIKHGSGGNNTTKAESIKDDLDRAETKVEQCQDQLAAEMFQLMSKEAVLAQTIFQYVKLQRAYHESALHCLKDVIPQLERYINDNQMKPVYGCPLEKHLKLTNRKIALPIQICVSALLQTGMGEQGLFRIASGAAKLRRIKMSFDAWCITFSTALEYDPHTLAGALKSYLRELPEPLLTHQLYSEWMAIAKISNANERQKAIAELLQKLPTANLDNLRFLIKFLAILAKNELNKMTCQNLGIILAPNLIWNSQEDTSSIVMDTANHSSLIVEHLITNANHFFPGDIDFDEDLECPVTNGSDNQSVNLRRCVSNSSLSDHGESPSQGSPKPATRRKNKPAPTPPGNTPDKHEKRPDDKPPPAPDKPPRPVPINTATLNRASYKAARHSLSTELISQLTERTQLNKTFHNTSVDGDSRSVGFYTDPRDSLNPFEKDTNLESSVQKNNGNKSEDDFKHNPIIGFEGLMLKSTPTKDENIKNLETDTEISENAYKNSKPTHIDKPSPMNVERRKIPIATPRNLNNTMIYQAEDETVELRKKSDSIDKNNKPAVPERPAGLSRPSSLIRPQPRNSYENWDSETGLKSLEKLPTNSIDKKTTLNKLQVPDGINNSIINQNNGISSANLQRSPSVGSRPISTSVTPEKSGKPPRPDLPEQIKVHTRTRSEGNIIDMHVPSDTSLVPKSPHQQPQPVSPRFLPRPPRPIPPPPPPPTTRPKSEESTNL